VTTALEFTKDTFFQPLRINMLNINCKIPFHIYADKESKTLKWRDLIGPEKLKLFKLIKMQEL